MPIRARTDSTNDNFADPLGTVENEEGSADAVSGAGGVDESQPTPRRSPRRHKGSAQVRGSKGGGVRWNVGDAAADAAVLAKAAESGSRGSCAGKKRTDDQTGLAAKTAGSGGRRKCGGSKCASEQVARGDKRAKTLNKRIADMASVCVMFSHFSRTID